MNPPPLTFGEWCESAKPDVIIFPPPLALRLEHEAAIGNGRCNPSEFGCEVVMAIRDVFYGRWPSEN